MSLSRHIVAIIGGAVSGAEAASQLSGKGITTVVFDQSYLPYGKIEDGLPKWHVKLRDQEEEKINRKLSHPLVHFVPGIRLGRDIDLEDLANNWGFSAVLLAIGASRDRPLPIAGINDFAGKGFYYQNPFIYWFNHKHEPGYQGPHCEIADGAIIVGGGLASLDVAKVLMFETVEKALRKQGYETDLFTLDRSIAKVLDELNLTLEDLGLRGCTIYYRRRIQDMPLSPIATDTPEMLAKAQKVRRKILDNYKRKYLFRVKPCHMPIDLIIENDRLAGLVFQKTRIDKGKVIPVPGSAEEVHAPLVISSIGSIPEQIHGIPMDGQIYRILSHECCRIEGFSNVFALGNTVTGRGNIRESMKHGRQVAQTMADEYLMETVYENNFRKTENKSNNNVSDITRHLAGITPPDEDRRAQILGKVKKLQHRVGYDGNFPAWVDKHLPVRLENLLGHSH